MRVRGQRFDCSPLVSLRLRVCVCMCACVCVDERMGRKVCWQTQSHTQQSPSYDECVECMMHDAGSAGSSRRRRERECFKRVRRRHLVADLSFRCAQAARKRSKRLSPPADTHINRLFGSERLATVQSHSVSNGRVMSNDERNKLTGKIIRGPWSLDDRRDTDLYTGLQVGLESTTAAHRLPERSLLKKLPSPPPLDVSAAAATVGAAVVFLLLLPLLGFSWDVETPGKAKSGPAVAS